MLTASQLTSNMTATSAGSKLEDAEHRLRMKDEQLAALREQMAALQAQLEVVQAADEGAPFNAAPGIMLALFV